ncbi:NPC intracellular cholesterol transporter 2 homolog a-like isoform X2 [Homarus americanus]|uniref:NPC intracellular cholesterol transporter 2 homolog a-like isoform X2 n=1 Tax=Homarus americanus TaxID=6706 RepID=UPI001C45E622|nr:NPC intracellular cholesterol transporter 2 homolog a-like isoform X2 [Homarus americanus]
MQKGSSAVVDFSKLQITGCNEGGSKCIFRKGRNASISLPFTPKAEVLSVTAKVEGILGPIPVPFQLDNPNGCVNSGLQCPLQANQLSTYTSAIEVKNVYPSISLKVRWQLLDEHNNKIVCLEIPVKIESSRK